MLFFHERISSGISREKLRAYWGPHGIISYIYILLYVQPNTARMRLRACSKTYIIENPSTRRRRGLGGFTGASEGCFVVYMAGREVKSHRTPPHIEEKRELRDQRFLRVPRTALATHYNTVSVAVVACELAAKGLYIYI